MLGDDVPNATALLRLGRKLTPTWLFWVPTNFCFLDLILCRSVESVKERMGGMLAFRYCSNAALLRIVLTLGFFFRSQGQLGLPSAVSAPYQCWIVASLATISSSTNLIRLQDLYRRILLVDLDTALEKLVDQDL